MACEKMKGKVSLELTLEQYADLREALSYLRKHLLLDPRLANESVRAPKEISDLLATLSEQMDGDELAIALIRKSR